MTKDSPRAAARSRPPGIGPHHVPVQRLRRLQEALPETRGDPRQQREPGRVPGLQPGSRPEQGHPARRRIARPPQPGADRVQQPVLDVPDRLGAGCEPAEDLDHPLGVVRNLHQRRAAALDRGVVEEPEQRAQVAAHRTAAQRNPPDGEPRPRRQPERAPGVPIGTEVHGVPADDVPDGPVPDPGPRRGRLRLRHEEPAARQPGDPVQDGEVASDTAAITSTGWPRRALCSSSSTSPQRGQPSAGK